LGLPSLLGRIRDSAPDVVVIQYVPHLFQRQGFSVPMAEFVALLRRLGFKVVTVAHELYYGRHEGWKVQPFGWAQRYSLLPLFWGSARVVLTVPDRLTRMKSLFSRWADKFTLLPVGPNLRPAEGADVAGWRSRHGVPDGAIVLLFMGLAHPSKELSMLTRTLDALATAGIPARLVLAGGATLAHPGAIELGFLSKADAELALAAADIAVLPFADGASARRTSLMNALAAGLPVVSTRGVNTDEALFPADAVTLVPAGDAEAFAQAVMALARDPAARRALGEAGHELLEARFSWDVLGEQWLALLESVAHP
jgi:glycosyltransferase involved in cell wall biosynthesis